MQLTYTASDPENHVDAIAALIPSAVRLVRVDGHSGVGKSRIAKALASFLPATRIDVDAFVDPNRVGRGYVPKVKVDELHLATRNALASGRVILDGLWLSELLPEGTFGRGFRICVVAPEHAAGPISGDEIRRRQQMRTGAYFRLHHPDRRADLLLSVPHSDD